MPAWYDVVAFGREQGGEHPPHVRESAALVERLLAREREQGATPARTVLAGFSQGAAMALHVGLRHAGALAGILVLSGYELLVDSRDEEQSQANRTTPILFCHGTYDPLVFVERGRGAFEALAPGRDARWLEFPMEHEVCDEEILVVRDWLHERLGG
jgi:phospholipase/carboxylesterase